MPLHCDGGTKVVVRGTRGNDDMMEVDEDDILPNELEGTDSHK